MIGMTQTEIYQFFVCPIWQGDPIHDEGWTVEAYFSWEAASKYVADYDVKVGSVSNVMHVLVLRVQDNTPFKYRVTSKLNPTYDVEILS